MNIHLDELPPLVGPKEWVGVDIEIFTKKGDLNHLHRPHTGRFAALQIAVGEDVYVITKEDCVQDALNQIDAATWVIHNGKFDLMHLRRWANVPPRKKYYDTMYIEKILWNGFFIHFSLAAVVRRYLGIYLEKDVRETFEGATELTREQIEYAALDPYYTLLVAKEQRKRLTEKDIYIWSKIDRPAVWAFLDFKGFAINVERWTELGNEHLRLRDEVDARLPLNPRSPDQIMKFIRAAGLKAKSTEAEELEKLLDRGDLDDDVASVISDILLSKNYGTYASRYGLKFIADFLEQEDGVDVIFGDYKVNHAETGRTACEHPNMQNIPARDTKVFRECFIARPGHKLIIADFSSQEPYISAIVSGEPKLIEWIMQGKDIYIEMAREVFGKIITKGDPERAHMKSVILGGNYGMSKYGLAKKLKCTPDEAQYLIDRTHKVLPVLAKYMERQRQERTIVYTPFGRKVWLNPYSFQAERNALNAPIQGGAGDQMKAALGALHQDWSNHFFTDFPVVGYIHDELVSDVREEHAEDAAEYIKTIMETTATEMVKGIIRFKVDVHIGNTWAEKG